jgi:hypothetical protein
MAKTLRRYISDGVTTIYPVDFTLGYLKQEYVYVYLSSGEYTTELEYSWLNESQIELTAPVAEGELLIIRRVVERSVPINDYENGAILGEKGLDDSFKQALMILEEEEDGAFGGVTTQWDYGRTSAEVQVYTDYGLTTSAITESLDFGSV